MRDFYGDGDEIRDAAARRELRDRAASRERWAVATARAERSRVSEPPARPDLRPMAMPARDIRPGMVCSMILGGQPAPHLGTVERIEEIPPNIVHPQGMRRFHVRPGIQFTVEADAALQVVGEEVRGYGELAHGDVVRVQDGWAVIPDPRADRVITAPGRIVVRAYTDPAFELAQAHTD